MRTFSASLLANNYGHNSNLRSEYHSTLIYGAFEASQGICRADLFTKCKNQRKRDIRLYNENYLLDKETKTKQQWNEVVEDERERFVARGLNPWIKK